MAASSQAQGLRPVDYLLVGAFCLALFGTSLVGGRVLTGHESVGAQTAREMFATHDWLIPRCGGFPWLERPPLPQWITVAIATPFGRCDRDWIVRLGPILMGLLITVLVARMAAGWYGRALGVLSGLTLASMWEFWVFATDPEADMFLCAIVTAAIAAFVHLEFVRKPSDADTAFFGGRPWPVLAFFVLWGTTNLAKGLIFGTVMVAVPVVGWLAVNLDLRAVRRYIWLWGWVAFAAVALAWPLVIYQQYPDILDLWQSDYTGRLNRGYIGEPAWYYAATLPYVMLPWTIPALVGLYLTGRKAIGQRHTPERFLWTWALLTPAVFSIPDGKHHHYLLPCLAPWAVLAALGSIRIWQWIRQWPAWLQNPYVGVATLGLAGDLALWLLGGRIPGPSWLVPVLLVAWPLSIFAMCWSLAQRDGRVAAGTFFTILAVLYGAGYVYQTQYFDTYRDDSDFLAEVRRMTPDRPLYVNFDELYPLETFHLLFYSDDHTVLLHNLTFLLDQRIRQPEVYVLCRRWEGAYLASLGRAEVILESKHTRGERSPADRRALFRLRFRANLARVPADVRLSPMQATHRTPGPYLFAAVAQGR
jgi:4-amino-4-deoxy-L-arabinose transferase-like glycosyltransferase